jgi:hypothetical protein
MKSNRQTWLLPKLGDTFFAAIFVAVLMLGTQMLNLDGDLPRHLLMGKYILQNLDVPTTELFIYPYLNQPYIPHEWLTNVIFYIIYSNWGFAGLVLLSALLLATTFTVLYDRLSTWLDLRLPVLLLMAWGVAATSLNWAVRPHLISMCLLAFWLLWAEDLRRGRKTKLWIFPIVMLVWSNLHGEFIAGILVLLAYATGWTLEYLFDRSYADLTVGKNVWLALFMSTLASLMNPSGTGPWLSIFGFVNNRYLMSRMAEANPPDFHNPDMRVLLGLLAVSVLVLAIKRERLSVGQGLLLAGFSAMSLVATRNIHLYGVVAPFVLAETLIEARSFSVIGRLETSLSRIENNLKGWGWSIGFVATSIIVLTLNPQIHTLYQLKEPAFPVSAMDWLKNNPQQGKVFNDLNWGGYLELHLWPDHLSFIDSMADISGTVTREYETVITLQPGWQGIFEQYEIAWAILPANTALANELNSQGWEQAYADQTAVILNK